MLSKWRGRGGVVEVPAADVWQFLPLVALSGGEVAVGIEDRVDVPREVEREDIVQHELPLEAREVDDLFKRLGGGRRGGCLRRVPRSPLSRRIAGLPCRDTC